MPFDSHSNFGGSLVVTAPVPATTGLSLTVTAGTGVRFPAAPFNCTVCPGGVSADATNAEIVRVTAVVGDTFTIVRAQEGTLGIPIAAGYQVLNVPSVKVFTDIESVIIQGISAVGGVATASQVVFSNANGVSFGVAGQTVTASVSAVGGALTNINVSAGTTSNNLSAFTLSNSNNVSFGLNGSTITASATVASSQGSIVFFAPVGTVTASQFFFSNVNNVSFGIAGSTITASVPTAIIQSNQNVTAANGGFAFQTLSFSNANNVSFSTSAGSAIVASASFAQTAQTGISGLQVSNTTYTSGTVTFQNANGISFGSSGANGISASYTVPTVTNSSWTVSDSATSGTVARLAFTNLNGVTLSLSTGAGGSHTIVGSHNALTSQSNQNVTAGNGGFAFQTLSFSNANNVSFSTSAGNAIVASVTVASTQASINLSAGTTSNNASAFTFSNLNGVSFGLNASTITASIATSLTNINVSAGTTSNNLSAITFSNANGISFGLNGSTITASVGAGGAAGSISAGTTSVALGQAVFSNSNLVSFGLNGSTVTAQHALNFSAGTTSNEVSSQLVFGNNAFVSFGLNASTITARAPTLSFWEMSVQPNNTSVLSIGQNSVAIDPLILPVAISFTGINVMASINAQGQSSNPSLTQRLGYTRSLAIYSRSVTDSGATNFSNSTNLVSFFSTNWTLSVSGSASSNSITASIGWGTGSTNGSSSVTFSSVAATLTNASFTGWKVFGIGAATSLSAGEYWIAQGNSSSVIGAGVNANFLMSQFVGVQATGLAFAAGVGFVSNDSNGVIPGLGLLSVTTAAFPSSLVFSSISKEAQMRRRHMIFQA